MTDVMNADPKDFPHTMVVGESNKPSLESHIEDMVERCARVGYDQMRASTGINALGDQEVHSWENQSDVLKDDWRLTVCAIFKEAGERIVKDPPMIFGGTDGKIYLIDPKECSSDV